MKKEIKIFYTKDWPSSSAGKADYELLDTGEGEKLERFGPYTFIRPYKDAVWPKCQTPSVGQMWMKADGKFWSSKSGGKGGIQTSITNYITFYTSASTGFGKRPARPRHEFLICVSPYIYVSDLGGTEDILFRDLGTSKFHPQTRFCLY